MDWINLIHHSGHQVDRPGRGAADRLRVSDLVRAQADRPVPAAHRPEPGLEVRPGASDCRRAQDDLQGRDHPRLHVDKILFVLGPALAIVPALLIFAVIPVGPTITLFGTKIPLVVADVNIGVLWVLAVAGVGTYGIILGGWASNNKYSLLGALRTSAQMLSYELPMGILLIARAAGVRHAEPEPDRHAHRPGALVFPGLAAAGLPVLLHHHAGRDQPQARSTSPRPKTSWWPVPDRVRQHQVRAVLHDRIPAHPGRQRSWPSRCSSAAGAGRSWTRSRSWGRSTSSARSSPWSSCSSG